MFDTIKTLKQCYDVLTEGIAAVIYTEYIPRSFRLTWEIMFLELS